jgi:putative Mg2+ transporter-C (MgtC) family protein
VELLWRELTGGLGDADQLARVVVRLVAAMLLGGMIGYERERAGRWAGLRTHILVALGSALMVLIPSEAGLGMEGVTRVVQGIATGIGFIGAGSILKLTKRREIHGLTTAAGIWVTSAVGIAVGLGFLGPAILSVVLVLVVLAGIGHVERRLSPPRSTPESRETRPEGSEAGRRRV